MTSSHIQLAMNSFAVRVASRLTDANNELPHDVTERLRAARVQAVDKRKQILMQTASEFNVVSHSNILSLNHGHEHASWWNKLGAIGLLLTLVIGIFVTNLVQDELRIRELADIDSALLTDDLPPSAYVDPGFAQFLKSNNR
jgi:hypothetical protein